MGAFSLLSSLHIGTLLLVLILGLFSYLFVLAAYRVFFHPLAKYPGPLLAKVTDLYQTYYAWKGRRHLEFARCHEKYGNIVRFGPNSLSFNTNTALKVSALTYNCRTNESEKSLKCVC